MTSPFTLCSPADCLPVGPDWTYEPKLDGIGHWEGDRYQDWLDCEPRLVVEVSYRQLEGTGFRHPVRLLRLRPDRDARDWRSISSEFLRDWSLKVKG